MPIVRIFAIHEAVAAGRYPNCSSLAVDLGSSTKTVQKDINFMRKSLNLPIHYNPQRLGYEYTEGVIDIPVLEFESKDLTGLFLARQAISNCGGTKIEKMLKGAFSRAVKDMDGDVALGWTQLDRALSAKPAGEAKIDPRIFGDVIKAVLVRREIEFSYRGLAAARTAKRRLRPYHLEQIERCWYLIGWDLDREAIRSFAMPRVKAPKILKNSFQVPEDFARLSGLDSSFGAWFDPERPDFKQSVRVQLTGYAARLAQERQWHPSQKLVPLNSKGTRVEVRFEVGRLEDLVRWVLSWGAQAKVLSPKKLKILVADEVRKMAAIR